MHVPRAKVVLLFPKMHEKIRKYTQEHEKQAYKSLVRNGKYFVAPKQSADNFKVFFARLAAEGVGRPVDCEGFPDGPWTPELLTDAICAIEANRVGIELRTVQVWFQDNDNGIGTNNLRWLARIFGCGDPETASQWQAVLSAANRRLAEERKAKRKAPTTPSQLSSEANDSVNSEIPLANVVATNTNAPNQRFNLAKQTEALFVSPSSLGLPVIVFAAATALGLIAYTLNIHSVVFTLEGGSAKQVGFLWAPNWTIVFLIVLPMFPTILIDLLRCWKIEWRKGLVASRGQKLSLDSRKDRVAVSSNTYWAILFVTVLIASGYNWTATHLIPLLTGDAGGWPVDWGKIAIFHPELISVPSTIIFTGLVFLYNAFCAYIFFSGIVFLHAITHDYLDVVNGFKATSSEDFHQHIEKISYSLMYGIFRCTSLGMVITILMKLQSGFLQSDSLNILDWLLTDLRSLFKMAEAHESTAQPLRSAPGHFYSFFCMLVIFGTFVNSSIKMRPTFPQRRFPDSENGFSMTWMAMNGSILLLLVSYLLIGVFTGFTIVVLLSLALTVYLVTKPAFCLGSNYLGKLG